MWFLCHNISLMVNPSGIYQTITGERTRIMGDSLNWPVTGPALGAAPVGGGLLIDVQ